MLYLRSTSHMPTLVVTTWAAPSIAPPPGSRRAKQQIIINTCSNTHLWSSVDEPGNFVKVGAGFLCDKINSETVPVQYNVVRHSIRHWKQFWRIFLVLLRNFLNFYPVEEPIIFFAARAHRTFAVSATQHFPSVPVYYTTNRFEYICSKFMVRGSSSSLTAWIEECLWDLEPLVSVLVIESVGELVGHVGHRANRILGVGHVVHLGRGIDSFRSVSRQWYRSWDPYIDSWNKNPIVSHFKE